jgi:probable HAF family extracellular repeat protein
MKNRVATLFVCVSALATFAQQPHAQARKDRSDIATLSTLPSLGGGPSEALAVNDAGTVIVGYSWDRVDVLHAVKWTLQNGSWTIASLPHGSATSAIARGVNNQGDAAGNNFPSSTSHPVLWPATGGFIVLGCDDAVGPATVYGISAAAQIVVGQQGGTAAVWQPGSCRAALPPIADGSSAGARAVNGDGTIVGGAAAPDLSNSWIPVRWRLTDGQWQIEPLDTRAGAASGANDAGDLAGIVSVPCAVDGGCQRAVIWYAAGGTFELGTLGGANSSARDINGSREVVGLSTSPRIGNTGFFWSESLGMFQLPFKGSWAAANAVSDVRPDGTRLVVGMSSQGVAVVWVVRNP